MPRLASELLTDSPPGNPRLELVPWGERRSRKKRFSAEEKALIVEEAASKEIADVEVCRRRGIEP